MAYHVEEVYHPLLNAIARAHLETFARFNLRSPRLGSTLLRDLHDLLMPWSQLRFGEFTPATETAMLELTQDLTDLGFNMGWLRARGFALMAAGERPGLPPEIQNLSAQVESTRQHLTDLEARLLKPDDMTRSWLSQG
ncbi:hypothetical protein RHMOL_Rhmol01G0239600 [Rhododendron molle]|uniref:Uncharacterized protein n=1 Tax=Rhododendron molle TaxID=49168 RepID=A0ACC0Q6N8_RHOML|nr:hypothetical protein RHMOL_Rhmol01G0239600 [Rhododendron molle]